MKTQHIIISLLLALLVNFTQAKGTKTLYVADRKVPCAGTYECMQIREKAKNAWRNYPDTIQGFEYEEGYEYKIQVQPLQTGNSMAGMYDEKYKLVKVISKKKTSYNPAERIGDKRWTLSSMNDTHRTLGLSDSTIYISFDFKTGKVQGRSNCNNFTAQFTATASKISITGLAATKMMCRGEVIEKIIFNYYKAVTTYKLENNMLTLTEPDGSYIQFKTQ